MPARNSTPTGGSAGDLDDLSDIDSIDVDLSPGVLAQFAPDSIDALNAIPTSSAPSLDEIVNYKSSGEDGQSIVLGARVPVSWEAIINDIREARGTPFPSVFRVKSDFLRWCLWQGMMQAQALRRRIAEDQDRALAAGEDVDIDDRVDLPDPMIDAHMFSEKNMGMIAARAAIIKKVSEDVEAMADAIQLVMVAQEPAEAVGMLDAYMEGAMAQHSDFWRNYFVGILFGNAQLAANIAQLVMQRHATNEFLIAACVTFGAIRPEDRDAILQDAPEDDTVYNPA